MASSVSTAAHSEYKTMDVTRFLNKDVGDFMWGAVHFAKPQVADGVSRGLVIEADDVLIHLAWVHAIYEQVLPLAKSMCPIARTSHDLATTVAVHYLSVGESVPPHVDPFLVGILVVEDHFRGGEIVLHPPTGPEVLDLRAKHVCILDGRIPHEVQPVMFGTRISITMNFFTGNSKPTTFGH
jgi:hypothetical protein